MKAEEIKAFFPRKCLITQELIDSKKSILNAYPIENIK